MTQYPILAPVIALIIWTFVMWFWMYSKRLPAILKSKMKLDPYAPNGEQMSSLPAEVRWKADNYNHLMEQPTLFYALAISLALLDPHNATAVNWAWAYVALRVIHSFIQALYNNIEHRFYVYVLSNIPLIALTFISANKVFAS